MIFNNYTKDYLLFHADNLLILSHKTSEWCGNSPNIELDIAITNIALDMLGQARNYYQLVCENLDDGSTEDSLSFLRNSSEFLNSTLVEIPNEDFALTIVRLYLVSNYYSSTYKHIIDSCNEPKLVHIATKHLKETTYHLKWTREWIVRLFYGTIESSEKLVLASNKLSYYASNLFASRWFDRDILDSFNIDNHEVSKKAILLSKEELENKESIYLNLFDSSVSDSSMINDAIHTPYLELLLQEMQSVHRAHPNAIW